MAARTLVDFKGRILGICPLSRNIVNATVKVANDLQCKIKLTASRNQIDAEEFGGGYVENWSTIDFVRYIRRIDIHNWIIIGRDHAGPYQGKTKHFINTEDAIKESIQSLFKDIDCGFDYIHIDTCYTPNRNENLLLLYHKCKTYGVDKSIVYELGSEVQNADIGSPQEAQSFISELVRFCDGKSLDLPDYVVAQLGTLLITNKNIGVQKKIFSDKTIIERISILLDIFNHFDIKAKQHNSDYLSLEHIKTICNTGVSGINIGPELGHLETSLILEFMDIYNLKHLKNNFYNLCISSKKWQKWIPHETHVNDYTKVLLSGHYNYSTEIGKEILSKTKTYLKKINIDLDKEIQQIINDRIRNIAMIMYSLPQK